MSDRLDADEAPLSTSAFEQAPVAILVLDPDGRVRSANALAKQYLEVESANPDAVNWWRRVVERRGNGKGRVETRDAVVDGATIEWTARPFFDADGTVLGVFAEGRDVTEQRRTEHESQLLLRLALAIGHTDSLELAIAAALRTVCETSGWAMAEAWLREGEDETARLARGAVWTTRDPRIEAFAAQGIGFQFVRGEGLPGKAWERAEPVWEGKLTTAETFTRAPLAATAGLKAAVAIPVLAGDDVVAVLSFYMKEARSEDTRFARITTAVASQLGALILQKQAEEAHRVAEAKLGGIVSIAVDAIISIDEDRRITMFNWGAERIFGYSAEEILGQPLDILLPPAARARHGTHIANFATSSQTARRMGERSPIAGLRKSGEIFPAEASISRFRAGGRWTFTVTLRDITDRQRTEEGLRFLSEAGALLSDLIRDPTALERVAQRAVPTLGDVCAIDLLDGTSIATVATAASDPALPPMLRRAPLTWDADDPVVVTLRDGTTRLLPDDGEPQPGFGSLLIVPLVAQGAVLGAMTFAMARGGRRHDASYRALAEELAVRVALAVNGGRLYQHTRRAVSARDEVLAVVSHDLRNPLSAINMCAGALRESQADAETTRELLATVQESTALMSRIIQDLLDVASIDARKLSIERRRRPLGPVLGQAIAMFESVAAEKQLTLQNAASASLPDVSMDGDRILQVMANLLHNACKFTPAGGAISIETTTLPDAVQVAVSDTGPGIARDDLPRVFDRFWHDRRESQIRSTGLGLAIARGIVEAHDGRIWVESAPGKGSTFTFTLPIAAASVVVG
ncbi:MAG TPA: ATP-binding protein [Gemmatimonadaceae bacterium]|nr:ATP-binding protein [Gemmatimonadaceae bacterium]